MTGVFGSYKVNDNISFSAGIANQDGGLGSFIPPSFVKNTGFESASTYMGSVALTAPDSMGFLKGATLSAGVIHGIDSTFNVGDNTSWYVGVTVPTPMNQLKVGAAFDYLSEDNFDQVQQPNENATVWDIAGYATYQATDKLSVNARAELLKDGTQFDGANVSLYPNLNGGSEQYAEEITVTVQYNLWANVITRGEFRWDHTDENNFGVEDNGSGDPNRKDDFLLALNVIYQF